eukprot:TRINITY_DN2143_c0_g1_i1.p1 TRINITY_DN2143_c0_g1~~TRINITY_DN2143_c0_g1_i1.p1  ORF type:complete len:110 (-),score=36.99 TRINITY_DN2143_c0_g1_i1:69-365(-)
MEQQRDGDGRQNNINNSNNNNNNNKGVSHASPSKRNSARNSTRLSENTEEKEQFQRSQSEGALISITSEDQNTTPQLQNSTHSSIPQVAFKFISKYST